MSKLLAIWVLPLHSSETRFKRTEIFWRLLILLGFLFLSIFCALIFFCNQCRLAVSSNLWFMWLLLFLTTSTSCWSIPGHLPLLTHGSGLRIAPTLHFSSGHASNIPQLAQPLCVSENSLCLFSNNGILAVIASLWGICIYGIRRHRFQISVPVIPSALDSFCTKNTDFNIAVGGCSFSVDSTSIKCHFLSSLCSWRLSQVTELNLRYRRTTLSHWALRIRNMLRIYLLLLSWIIMNLSQPFVNQ